MNYKIFVPITNNAPVSGAKAVLLSNESNRAKEVEYYTYGITGATASSRITLAASSTVLLPVKVCGVSFNSEQIKAFALS